MVFCWDATEPQPVLEPEEQDEFDVILAGRTRTSWDNDIEFEGNDASMGDSVEYPEDVSKDVGSDYQLDNTRKTIDRMHEESILFPWPFNATEAATEERDDRHERSEDTTVESTSEPKPELGPEPVGDTKEVEKSPPSKISIAPKVLAGNIIHSESGEGLEVPFDELIPPSSDGVQVPFDECPLSQSVSNGSESQEGEYDPIMMAYVSDDETADRSASGRCRLDTIEEARSLDEEETCSDKAKTFDGMTAEDRANMLIANAHAEMNIDKMVMDLESIAHRLDALNDNIQECNTMDSAHSNLQKAHSTDCTDFLIRTLSSVDKEPEESVVEDLVVSPPPVSETFHPPSVRDQIKKIEKSIENNKDESFDEIEQLRTQESTISTLQGAPSTTSAQDEPPSIKHSSSIPTTPPVQDEPPAIEPSPSILRSATSKDDDTMASSKRVTFSEAVVQCPSDQGSDLAFDYENHAFEENDKIAYDKYGNPYRRIVKDSYDYQEDTFYDDDSVDVTLDGSRPWYEMLVQAK